MPHATSFAESLREGGGFFGNSSVVLVVLSTKISIYSSRSVSWYAARALFLAPSIGDARVFRCISTHYKMTNQMVCRRDNNLRPMPFLGTYSITADVSFRKIVEWLLSGNWFSYASWWGLLTVAIWIFGVEPAKDFLMKSNT